MENRNPKNRQGGKANERKETRTMSARNASNMTSPTGKTSMTSSTTTAMASTLTAGLVTVPTTPDPEEEEEAFLIYVSIGVGSAVFLIILSILICFICRSRRRARSNVRAMQKARSRPVSSFLQYSDAASGTSSPVREVHSPLYATDPERYITGTQPEIPEKQPDISETHLYENFGTNGNMAANQVRVETDVQTEILATANDRKVSKSGSQVDQPVRQDSTGSYVDPNEVVDIKMTAETNDTRGKLVKQSNVEYNGTAEDSDPDYENSATLSIGGASSILDRINKRTGSTNQSKEGGVKHSVPEINLVRLQPVKQKSSEKQKIIDADAFDGKKPKARNESQGSSGDEILIDYENAGMFKKETGHKSAEMIKPNELNAKRQMAHVQSLTTLFGAANNCPQGNRPREQISPLSPASAKKLSHIMKSDHHRKKHKRRDNKERSKTTTAIPSLAVIQPVRKVSEGNMFPCNNDPPPSPCVTNHRYVNVPKKNGPAVAPKPVKKFDDRSTSCPEPVSPVERTALDDLYLDMDVTASFSTDLNLSGLPSAEGDLPMYCNAGYVEDMYVQPCPASSQDPSNKYMNIARSQSLNEGYENPDEVRMLRH